MHKILFFLALIATSFFSKAQDVDSIIRWKFEIQNTGNNTYDVIATATIADKWYLYAADPGGDGSQIPTTLTVEENDLVKLIGDSHAQETPKAKYEPELDFTINIHEKQLTIIQKVETEYKTEIKGAVNFMTCTYDGLCLQPTERTFSHSVEGKEPPVINAKSELDASEDLEKKSLWELFIAGILAGFIAFIMPCIYAMLPITVSFFTKRSKNRATGIRNAIIYSLSIIAIFSAIGGLMSIFFGPKTMYELSTSMGFNLFVFVIFIVFGVSLLGAFEITLPASWSSKLDKKANSNSIGGIFFMALVLVVVSFSCTSAFISSLMVYIFTSGNSLGGIVGFFGFGLAIALPFAITALFPSLLNNIAKSGGWLNAVKVTMGFIEIAMAMKFLSNVDLQYHWGILNFDVYLSIWIVLFTVLGIYLLGFIRFSNDDGLPKNMFGQTYLSVTRLFFAMSSLAFAMYMVPGLWGAPLTPISGFLPERKTLEFNLNDKLIELQTNAAISLNQGDAGDENTIRPKRYANLLKSELPGIETYFDYEEALAASKVLNKPILLDFTGHSCINCRKMERAVLSKPEILRRLKQEFIVVSLYCDDRNSLDDDEKGQKDKNGNLIKTIGDKNIDLQLTKFQSVAQPLYVFVDANGNTLINAGGYDPDIQLFHKKMDEALKRFKE